MSVQDFACNNRVRWKKLTYGRGAFLENLSKCASCQRGRGQACVFLGEPNNWNGSCLIYAHGGLALECSGYRVIDEQTQQISFRVKPDPQSPEYPQVFNRPITSTDIELKAVRDSYGLTKEYFLIGTLESLCQGATPGTSKRTGSLQATQSHSPPKGGIDSCNLR